VKRMMLAAVAVTVAVIPAIGAGTKSLVDENLPVYKPVSGVSGNLKSEGSDTMNNLMTLWAEGFKRIYSSVNPEIVGKGSSTAPAALIAGTSTFGPMSRKMKPSEMDKFVKRFGYKATQLATSIDMLAVYVHKDNPIKGLSLKQIDAVFSKSRKGGFSKDIRTWGDLGLTGKWKDRPITLYGRNSASGTYGYFKKHALFKGDYKDSVKEQPGSSSVVTSVANDLGGIGYSGIGYKTADVAAVALSREGADYTPATPKNAYSGDYPLSRFLWLTVNYKPNSTLDPLRAEFIRYIYTQVGQKVVVKDGYFPVSAALATNELAKVGLAVRPVN